METKREDGKVIDNRLDLECWIDWRGKEKKIRVKYPKRDGKIVFRYIRIHLDDDRVVDCDQFKLDEFIDHFECSEGKVANGEELEKLLREHFATLQLPKDWPFPHGELSRFDFDLDEGTETYLGGELPGMPR